MSSTQDKSDEFDALRTIVKTLENFSAEDQQRVLRWASEKLGLSISATNQVTKAGRVLQETIPVEAIASSTVVDIKSFVNAKKPKNDTQFATVVAYYYRFEAPTNERKESISQDDLLDACRKTNYTRPPAPGQTLRNAMNAGLLDNTSRGLYSINSVGENLVAVTLPGDASTSVPVKKRSSQTKKSSPKKPSAKK